jgi:hypothetical protein
VLDIILIIAVLSLLEPVVTLIDPVLPDPFLQVMPADFVRDFTEKAYNFDIRGLASRGA